MIDPNAQRGHGRLGHDDEFGHHDEFGHRRGGRRRPHHLDPHESLRPHRWFREFLNPSRGPRIAIRRGNVRPAILAALKDRPMHGYQIIQELEAKTGGRWRPSAGSIYPTLQQLEDEGLVASEEVEGRRTYSLTEEGKKGANDSPLDRRDWLEVDLRELADIRRLAIQLVGAAIEVSRVGSPAA